jgi:hypothetical protein
MGAIKEAKGELKDKSKQDGSRKQVGGLRLNPTKKESVLTFYKGRPSLSLCQTSAFRRLTRGVAMNLQPDASLHVVNVGSRVKRHDENLEKAQFYPQEYAHQLATM